MNNFRHNVIHLTPQKYIYKTDYHSPFVRCLVTGVISPEIMLPEIFSCLLRCWVMLPEFEQVYYIENEGDRDVRMLLSTITFWVTSLSISGDLHFQGRCQIFSRGTHNFSNPSSPFSLYNNVVMLFTSTLLLFMHFFARFFTDIRVSKRKSPLFLKNIFQRNT